MGAADLAADLLQETDPAKAEELAKQLCDLNRERQAVEQSICADAIAQIERLRPEERKDVYKRQPLEKPFILARTRLVRTSRLSTRP